MSALGRSFALALALHVPEGYLTETLPNGLEVSILPDARNPVVATQVWFHVGSAHEDPGSRGLAHLFEHLMFGPTARHAKEDYARFHTVHGGSENAFTSPDETVYVSEIAPAQHLEVLEFEADRMTGLALDAGNLENEKRIVTEELRLRTENDPFSRLLSAAQKTLLGSHPYAHDPSGTKEDVAAATLESCRRFYDSYYRPNQAHVVVVGPVDGPQTLAAIRAAFGAIPAGGAQPPEVPALADWSFPQDVELREDLPPVEIAVVGFPIPPADSEDTDALELLFEMLSGGTQDLFREEHVVKRHRALEAGAELLALRRGGGILFYSVNLPYRRKATAFSDVAETLEALARLDWLTEARLASAKRAILREELRSVYFAESRADAIGRARYWLADDRRAFDRAERIRAVTLDEVRAAYQKHLREGSPIRLYVRPEKIPLTVRLFGWLAPLFLR